MPGSGGPRRRCFHELFEEQAARTPDAIALEFRGRELTYAGLNARANLLAERLRARKVGPERLVGLYCARSLELTVGLLATLKAGGAFLPLDASLPRERLAFILDDARPELVLTQSKLAERLPRGVAHVLLDAPGRRSVEEAPPNPESGAGPENLAYVLYTSGSTGLPKGVEIEHRGLANYLGWAVAAYAMRVGCGAPVHSSIGFDATITAWLAPLIVGGTVTLVPEGRELEGLAELLRSERDFSVVKLTPSHLEALRHLLPNGETPCARAFVIGGEALPGHQLAEWQARAPQTRLFNEYGPTETVVGCCAYEAGPREGGPGPAPIGRPITNTQLHVLDDAMRPVHGGAAGELYIGGAGVARGYRGRPMLTAERFLPNPFGPGRLYRTGDLVKRLPDGNLVFLDRVDEQVKIRGHRIEPGEIEAALAAHPAVRSCAVVAREERPGEKRLVAYVVPSAGCSREPEEGWAAAFLETKLPSYMLPSAYVMLERLPLTSNGKLDRAALPAPAKKEVRRGRSPRTNLELQLLRMWERTLGVSPIGVHENFFELGGHSLMAVRLLAQVERAVGRRLPLAAIFAAPTVEQMARMIGDTRADEVGPVVPIQPEGLRPPLFCVHGIGGGILNYGHLARRLPDDQPVYGLQARGMDGREAPHTRVEDMAADYLREIRRIQPEGPYHLCGYSFGGLVAFEMARQLEANGERVAALLLLDSAPHNVLRTLSRTEYCVAVIRRQAGRFRLHAGNLLRLPTAEKGQYILREWKTLRRKIGNRAWQFRYRVYEKTGEAAPKAFADVKEAAYLALRRYVPGTYSGGAVLFTAEQRPRLSDGDESLGWRRLIHGGVEVRVVPGEHNTIAVGENAAVLAGEIMSALDRADCADEACDAA